MPLVAAIDQGTTSTRCILFDGDGHPVASCQREHEQIYPKPGWVEHDPQEIWRRAQQVVDGALREAGASGDGLAAVGLTNQRETTVVWDKTTGQPLHHAVVWQDTRTKDLCDRLARDGGQDRFRARTGLPLATYFSAPKIAWLLEHVPGLRDKAERGEALFGTIDTWLIWNLTGGRHVTDPTNASRTMLMDLSSGDWSDALLEAFGVPRAMLPEIVPSSSADACGRTRPGGPFGASVPICGDLGDQQAALVGQRCFGVGEAKNTYGTGCFLLMNTGEEPVASNHGLLTTVAYRFGDAAPTYALEGSVAIAGALVQWLRDNLRLIDRADEIEALAETVEDNGGVYFVPAFSGLFAPHWRSDARGVIAGLTRFAHRGHIARAALEATAFQTREILEAMSRDTGFDPPTLRVDGGMTANRLLMQFQADLLGMPVTCPAVAETTALGAAYAAGLGAGVWSGLDDLPADPSDRKTWQPAMTDARRDELYRHWLKAVQRTLDWA